MKRLLVVLCIVLAVLCLGLHIGYRRAQIAKLDMLKDEQVPYEALFRELAPTLGWDWQTLAAVAWEESHFNPHARSHAGACGVMQLMPQTAGKFGLNDSTVWVAEDNIRAGAEYIRFLQHKWSFISNPDEQLKFVLASYNAGPGVVFSARRQVREQNEGNPYLWSHVEQYVESIHPKQYVHKVMRTAERLRKEERDE